MTLDEKIYAKMRFDLLVYRLNGNAFEEFFVRIMVAENTNFIPVKPQGRLGDRSNDGFNPSSGTYYQVYAPENPSASISSSITKLHHDFTGLHSYWNTSTPIKEFKFVVNDKYMGVGPQLHPELKKLESSYPGIKCSEFFAQHLWDIALSLPDEKIYDIIGYIPSPDRITIFDSGVMDEVVNSLLRNYSSFTPSRMSKNPNFEPKISFNKLNNYPASLLRYASYQGGDLLEYFQTSVIHKDKLKQIFSDLYKRIDGQIDKNLPNRSDIIFDKILQEAHLQSSTRKEVNDVVLVLMAYYFDLCDIFEEPPLIPTGVQQTLFDSF